MDAGKRKCPLCGEVLQAVPFEIAEIPFEVVLALAARGVPLNEVKREKCPKGCVECWAFPVKAGQRTPNSQAN
jgi:hypothetical protein